MYKTTDWGIVYATAASFVKQYGRANDDGALLEAARVIGLHYGANARARQAYASAGRAGHMILEIAIRGRYRFEVRYYATEKRIVVGPVGADGIYSEKEASVDNGQAAIDAFERMIRDGDATPQDSLDREAVLALKYHVNINVDFPEDDDI